MEKIEIVVVVEKNPGPYNLGRFWKTCYITGVAYNYKAGGK